MESVRSSDVIRHNLNSMHKARQSFIEAEASEKIQRALKYKIRTYSETVFEKGEKVFYKRKSEKGWKGPATVLVQDNKWVLLRHGGAFYRCHACQVIKKDASVKASDEKRVNPRKTENKQKVVAKVQNQTVDDIECGSEESEEQDDLEEQERNSVVDNEENTVEEDHRDADDGGEEDLTSVNELVNEMENLELDDRFIRRDGSVLPKTKTHVEFKIQESDWKRGTVLSQQPKRSGMYKNWVNMQVDGEEKPCSVDWKQVTEWKDSTIEKVLFLNLTDELHQDVMDAKVKELENLEEHNVFERILDEGQSTISTKWVITEKFKDSNRKLKARLVARGFEEQSEGLKTDSPTCSKLSLRLVLTIASCMKWELCSLDITSSFLTRL